MFFLYIGRNSCGAPFFGLSGTLRGTIGTLACSLRTGQLPFLRRAPMRYTRAMKAAWGLLSVFPRCAPHAFVDIVHHRTMPGSLAVSGNSKPAEFDGWDYTAPWIYAK